MNCEELFKIVGTIINHGLNSEVILQKSNVIFSFGDKLRINYLHDNNDSFTVNVVLPKDSIDMKSLQKMLKDLQ